VNPALTCSNLVCGYPGRTVLTGINLDIRAGGITTLLGPNGSGKSTLLKTFVGEISPMGGEIRIQGKQAQTLTARERAKMIAFVPSEEKSRFPFTVREIVAMGRIPYSEGLFDSDEDKRITEDAMAKAECAELADRPITNVSAGERQRALIARALAQQAPLLLLDEPTSHLDPGHQVNFVLLIRQLAASGLSILVALHDLNLAAHLAHDGILFHEGKIACAGKIGEVLNSTDLDRAYGTSFERIKGSDGIVRLSPEFVVTR
jgi:iron complex transport system ATP-binding protein